MKIKKMSGIRYQVSVIAVLTVALLVGAAFPLRVGSAQFIDRIVRPCATGATLQANVIVNPSSSGNVAVTTCTGGSLIVNGSAVVPGGGAINPTNGIIPYRSSATAFSDSPLTRTSSTLVTSSAQITIAPTWNNVATTFTALLVNPTDTTSATGSLLLSLQDSGTTLFQVDKFGNVTDGGGWSWARPNARLSINTSANGTPLTLAGYSLVAADASPLLSMSGTWNTSGAPTLISANVVNTASGAASLLMDLQVGGVSQFKVNKAGVLTVNSCVGCGGITNGAAANVVPKSDGTNLVTSSLSDSGVFVSTAEPVAIGLGAVVPLTMFVVGDTSSGSPRGMMSWQSSTDTNGARFHLRKSRGTFAAPTIVVTGDTIGRMVASGYDGANFLEMGSIGIDATGTIAATRVPTQMVFRTATDATPSVLTTALTLGANQSATFAGAISGTSLVLSGGLSGATSLSTTGTVTIGNAGFFQTTSRANMSSPADGVWLMQNAAVNNFDRLQFGGTTSSFPSLKRSGAGLTVRLADDSADTTITASVYVAGGAVPAVSSGTIGPGSKNAAGFITSTTTGAYTGILTFSGFTATTGWSCSINNGTTANVMLQSGSSTTTATFTGTTVTGDVLRYVCVPY